MTLENNDWASCKATLVPCFVVLELWPTNVSHLPVDTVLGGTGGHCRWEGASISWFQSFSLVLLLSLCQHVPVSPATWRPVVHILRRCRPQRQLSQRHWHPANDFLPLPWCPACTSRWHLSTLHPVGHIWPSMRPKPQPCGQGKGSSKSVPPLGPLPQSNNSCSLQLLVLPSLEMYWPLFVVNQSHY